MSKKLMTVLDDIALMIYANTAKTDLPSEILLSLERRLIDDKIHRFLNFSSTELDKAYVIIGRDIYSLRERQLKEKENGSDLDDSAQYELRVLTIKMNILEAALEKRKEIRNRRGDHPVLHKHVDFPVFSVDKPKKVTLQKLMEGGRGIFIENRDGGYHQLRFANSNGTLLTDYDHRVFSSVCKVIVDKGCPKESRIELREIVEAMKIPVPGGGDFQSIRDSLWDIYNTSLIFEENLEGDLDDDTSFEYHRIFQKFGAKGKKFSSFTVLLQDYIHDALMNGEYFGINMYLMNDLSLDITKSLYKFVLNEYSKEEKDIYEFEFKTLRNHIDIDRNNPNRAHLSIKKGFQELQDSTIIDHFEDIRIGTGNWMYYVKPNSMQLKYAARSIEANNLDDGVIQQEFHL